MIPTGCLQILLPTCLISDILAARRSKVKVAYKLQQMKAKLPCYSRLGVLDKHYHQSPRWPNSDEPRHCVFTTKGLDLISDNLAAEFLECIQSQLSLTGVRTTCSVPNGSKGSHSPCLGR